MATSRPFQCITSCDNKFGARDFKCRLFLTRYMYFNILDSLFDIDTAMAATPFQADRKNAANTQKIPYKFLLHPLLSAEPDLNPATNGA